jgi:hypothetical protein
MIIPANNISSRCTSCGGTIFTGEADTEQSKIVNTPRRNSETNSFQNRGAKFGSRINLSEEDSVEVLLHSLLLLIPKKIMSLLHHPELVQ